jgi:hypothetical protein
VGARTTPKPRTKQIGHTLSKRTEAFQKPSFTSSLFRLSWLNSSGNASKYPTMASHTLVIASLQSSPWPHHRRRPSLATPPVKVEEQDATRPKSQRTSPHKQPVQPDIPSVRIDISIIRPQVQRPKHS